MTCKAFPQTEGYLSLTNQVDYVGLCLHAYSYQQFWRTETWIYEVFLIYLNNFIKCCYCGCMLSDKRI